MTHHELLQAVAAALGASASMDKGTPDFGKLEGAAVPVGVYHDERAGRLNVSVSWPRDGESARMRHPRDFLSRQEYNATPAAEISVSSSKPPETIARDIKRRLIDPNAALYQRALDTIAAEKAAERARGQMVADLVAQFPKHYRTDERDPARAHTQRGYYRLPDFSCGEEVHFESFYCSPAVAAEFLAVLTKHARKEGQ